MSILLFPAETKGLFRCASSPGKICAYAQTGVRPSAFFCGGSNPCSRVRIHIIKHNKNHATGRVFYCGGARNLLPLGYERPASNTRTKWLKTGKNREFLQKNVILTKVHTTCARIYLRFSKHLHSTNHKIPYKKQQGIFWTISGNYQRITGNFISTILENQFAIYTQSVYKRFIV